MPPHFTVAAGGCHIDRPMAGRAQIAAAAFFDGLKCAALNLLRHRVDGLHVSRPGYDGLDEKFVVQFFILEVTFFFRYPFLQSAMRLNQEFPHGFPLSRTEATPFGTRTSTNNPIENSSLY